MDFIREVKIQTSNFSAEYGRNSGASINVTTRSGGNQFHGSAFEFFRNDKLDARSFFAPVRAPLRFNNFGYSFGGPIIKNKFFFFGGQEWKYIRRSTDATARTLPTQAERLGDFSFRLRGTDGIVGTPDDGALRDPRNPLTTCVSPTITNGVITRPAVRTGCFPNNIIPTNRITADGRAIANIYNFVETQAASYTDRPIGNNAVYQRPNPFDFRQDILRLDYRFNENHNIYGRYIHDSYDLIDPFGNFNTSQLPTVPSRRVNPGTGIQTSYTWLINPQLINEAKINVSYSSQVNTPIGDISDRDTYGFTFPQLFRGGRFPDTIPNVTTLTGFTTFNGASQLIFAPTTDISFTDNLTIIRGNHALKIGLLVARNRKDQNRSVPYAGALNFSTGGNPNTTNNAFADALLGNFRSYSEAETEPVGFFRFSQVEAYVSDSWKVSSKLNLELGARYYYFQPVYTQANNIVNFDPSLYDPARAVRVLDNGTIRQASITAGANRYNGLIRAGDGVPQEEAGRVFNANDPRVLSVPVGAPRGLFESQHRIAPRFSFAYSPFADNRTSLRGGFGIFFDRPEGNVSYSTINNPPFNNGVQFDNGNLSNPAGGVVPALAVFNSIDALDPNFTIPYQMNFSFGVQRELPRGFFVEMTYVGNLGRHLIRNPDINQIPFSALRDNRNSQNQPIVSDLSLRPYKGYSAIRMRLADSISNYNSGQLFVAKRSGRLRLTGSYTFSKALTDASSNGENSEDAAFNRGFNYG